MFDVACKIRTCICILSTRHWIFCINLFLTTLIASPTRGGCTPASSEKGSINDDANQSHTLLNNQRGQEQSINR